MVPLAPVRSQHAAHAALDCYRVWALWVQQHESWMLADVNNARAKLQSGMHVWRQCACCVLCFVRCALLSGASLEAEGSQHEGSEAVTACNTAKQAPFPRTAPCHRVGRQGSTKGRARGSRARRPNTRATKGPLVNYDESAKHCPEPNRQARHSGPQYRKGSSTPRSIRHVTDAGTGTRCAQAALLSHPSTPDKSSRVLLCFAHSSVLS